MTDAVVERVAESEHLVFDAVGHVKLKGFDQPRQLCPGHIAPTQRHWAWARRAGRRAGDKYGEEVYKEPSRKTTKYNDATVLKTDVSALDKALEAYWDTLAATLMEGRKVK